MTAADTADPDFHGRRILITGGASGIGLATARLMTRRGARVGILDRRPDTIEVVQAAGLPTAHCEICDIRNTTAIAPAVERLATSLGGMDGLVNCAGIVSIGPIDNFDLATWQDILAVNLTGAFLTTQACLPWLRREDQASIVNVASAQALMPSARAAAYAASKAGLLAFSKSLAAELAPRIRVASVCPGIVDTPMHRAVHEGEDPADTQATLARYALRRIAQPEEVARAILFLSSADASFITGIALAVDGGRTFH